ncbi:MAG: glucose-6-phosphate isomerase [Aquabacterium sp.]|uniref:glucose-6-phosphate isomerase n=1 Tax=Aquabacterium sp. TaxID=1872578 RepID=UPI0025BCFF56|nr:glucose-6-phosphate isomerase [Aquabacterium sp.]MBI5925395.1 glucose-6-phosphate isomerase [Aquabacterium sp.]
MGYPRCDQTVAWSALSGHFEAHGRDLDLRQVFADNPDRVQCLGIQAPEVFADLSRAHWDVATMRHLLDLARECGLEARRDALLAGDIVNQTEGRAALHTALRAPRGPAPYSEQVHQVLDRMLAFVERVRLTAGGTAPGQITDVVNIGIGGSDLGPQMVVPALDAYVHPGLNFHFVSNADGQDLASVLRKVRPDHTLFVVASKTFTTQETMANAQAARQWFLDQGGKDIARHFVATTTNVELAAAFGITQTFGFWDWVGGRFSMWSAIGLPIALALGSSNFHAMLAGAHAMDEHFAQAPVQANLPMLLGLMDVWYRNFKGYTSRCVVPYHHGLRRLPAYLQQLVMESNGKSVDANGDPLPYATSDVLWGEPGTNGQHAFFQMLHQGSDVIPVEFLLVKHASYRAPGAMSPAMRALLGQQHHVLLANGLAQAQALTWGKSAADALQEHVPTASKDMSPQAIAKHRTFPGNRPSLTLLLDEVTPRSLGALVALYEHRTFVSGALWGINSFDQWGVELGKALCKDLLPRLTSGDTAGLDAATAAMIARLR